MSQVREPLPPGPGGPEQAPTENSSLISLPRGKTDQESAVAEDRDINQPSSNQSIQAEIQEQSIWGNRTDGDLIRRSRNRWTFAALSTIFHTFFLLLAITLLAVKSAVMKRWS